MQKILLLEDNYTDADLVSLSLKRRWPDLVVQAVNRVADAKKLIETKTAFDLAIFDLKLPDGTGLELLSQIREQQCILPVIILTGSGNEELATAALKAGANNYIVKAPGYHSKIPEQIEFTMAHAETTWKELSVLYVEHYQSDLELTRHHLKKYAPQIHLSAVSSGEEALSLLPQEETPDCPYHVLMLDYRLAGLNALEISRQIRLERKLTIAIVIVTGQGDESIAVEALKIGVDDYIVKGTNYLMRLPSVLTSAYQRRELERQQKAIKLSETKFRLLADYASDWEYWINPQGDYVYVSPACETVSGYPPQAFHQNKDLLTEITLPEYKQLVDDHFKHQQDQNLTPIDFAIRTSNGEVKWIQHNCREVFDEQNNYLGKRGVNRDITEQKRSETIQQILLNIANATQTARDIGEIIYTIQQELGRLMDTRNFYVALYDEHTDNIHLPFFKDEKDDIDEFPAGKTITGLVIKNGKSYLLSKADTERMEARGEIERVGYDSEVWLGVPLKTEGKVTGAFVVQSYNNPNAYSQKDKEVLEIVSHQISISIERKQQEEKLKEALEAAKESDKMKTAFLSNMSHELRTPLNAVIGFSSLIDKETPLDDVLVFNKLIHQSGINLLEIVDEIFEVTLLERGEININRSEQPLDQLFDNLYQTILHREKNLENNNVIEKPQINGIDKSALIVTDFIKLQQVFLSLLNNAIKFTHNGQIQFGVNADSKAGELVFYVRDTGIGISKETQKNIFELFEIGDDSRTRKYSGVGVGLHISKKLVALLGGRIWFDSALDKGSVFYFTLPY